MDILASGIAYICTVKLKNKNNMILPQAYSILQLFVSEGNSVSTRTFLEGNSKDQALFRKSKMTAKPFASCHFVIVRFLIC